ncbi:CBO0543 family protein [Neobacillus niacini]|uniref:CBO0543 family protein n=1 Tax=Neobacillus niacini TaxID=86668 RepID=UPI0021CB595D|nr:CBO0543 family protein [Neobacillus niacini]MCM3763685.1 hypothetical protein [Neobacillus niacini]
MSFDYFIIVMIWVISIITLFLAIPKARIREFVAVFLFFQALTWMFSITLTAFGLLSTEVRLFEHATKISFTSEFAFYPTLAVVFHRFYPEKAGKRKVILHYLLFVGIILLYMYLLDKFTGIMNGEITEQLIRTFFNFIFEFWLLRQYMVWFMRSMSSQAHHVSEGPQQWK